MMEHHSQPQLSLEETRKTERITPFLGTNKGCATLLGIVGTVSAGTFVAAYNLSNNNLYNGVAALTACTLSGFICDTFLRNAIDNNSPKEPYNYDNEFFRKAFYISQISRGLRTIGNYIAFWRR